ncbi:hypothetical protein J1N35_015869 [Gossypium stocksii]|uniref:Uncharacterized protein n=1 Tax=Gossypium stocksii TaxID=47602 RepID=A0A9D3VXP0_9ROSI|nr:hypothetical protein J1N35_015869 [Gossypium stocksii]
MALAQVSASLSLTVHDVSPIISPTTTHKFSRVPISSFSGTGSIFATGSPLLIGESFHQRKPVCKATTFTIKCEQSTKGGSSNSLDVWLGRLAMVGFAVAITVEISTGKGLLEVPTTPIVPILFWFMFFYVKTCSLFFNLVLCRILALQHLCLQWP